MEYAKVPNYPVQPMPMPMPMPMPAPAPIMQQPAHNDIHLHASYSHNEFVFPKPVHTQAVAAPCYPKNNSAASILVLFILLVIITRGICRH